MRSRTEGKKEEAVFYHGRKRIKVGGGRPAKWGSNWYMKGSRWLGCSPNRKVSEGRKGVSRTASGRLRGKEKKKRRSLRVNVTLRDLIVENGQEMRAIERN